MLITSRRHLTALEDAQPISLDILAAAEAAALLVRVAARPGLESGDGAVAKICRLCGYLPLAIGMLARQLHHHPAWTAADLASELGAARDRLELMHAESVGSRRVRPVLPDLLTASSCCSAVSGCIRAPISTPGPPPPWMAPTPAAPDATWKRFMTSTC